MHFSIQAIKITLILGSRKTKAQKTRLLCKKDLHTWDYNLCKTNEKFLVGQIVQPKIL